MRDLLPHSSYDRSQRKHRSKLYIIIVMIILSTLYFVSLFICVYLNDHVLESDYPLITKYQRFITIPSLLNGTKKLISIDIHSLVAYVDIWRGHWCPYYNDRNFYIAPRVNELLQIIRTIGIPASHLSFTAESAMMNTRQRKRAKKVIRGGNITKLDNYEPKPNMSYPKYIPGFVDKCNHNMSRFNIYRDHGFSRDILLADDDYYVASFKEAVMLFWGLGAKYVLIFGEHTNMCLMHVIMYCQEVGITPVIVRDLVDSAWVYEYQKQTIPSHSLANNAVNTFLQDNQVPLIHSYDLIRTLNELTYKKICPRYNLEESAMKFNNIKCKKS